MPTRPKGSKLRKRAEGRARKLRALRKARKGPRVTIVRAFGRLELEVPTTDTRWSIGCQAPSAVAMLTPAEAFRIGFALIEWARYSPGFGEG